MKNEAVCLALEVKLCNQIMKICQKGKKSDAEELKEACDVQCTA